MSKIDVPTDITENLMWRSRLIAKCGQDLKLAAKVKKVFQEDPIFAFRAFFFTYDPRPNVLVHKLPFIPYDFQEDAIYQLIYHIEVGKDLAIFKSRDMGISWICLTTLLWLWLKNVDGWDFLIGSRKEEYVDKKGDINALFPKIRYNLYNLPEWLLPEGFEATQHDNHMIIRNSESGCVIRGEANNANFGTGGRFRAALVDEFAKWEHTDKAAWTSLGDTTPCRIPISTPKGRDNKFAELVRGEDGSNIDVIKLHWTLHPKKDQAWYDSECERRSDLEIAQELDLSFEGSAGQRFFTDYSKDLHWVDSQDVIPGKEVVVGFDFGYIHPALVATQIDDHDRWIWQRTILGKDVEIRTFAKYCWKRLLEWYPTNEFTFYVDIAGAQRSDKSEKTSVQILRDIIDATIIYKKVDRESINTKMREMLNSNIAGKPSLLVQNYKPDEEYVLPAYIEREDMKYFHEGFIGGIHYPDSKVLKEDWEKDKYYEHGFDAAGFIVQSLFMRNKSPSKRLEQQRKIKEHNQSMNHIRSGAYGGRFNLHAWRSKKVAPRFGNISGK